MSATEKGNRMIERGATVRITTTNGGEMVGTLHEAYRGPSYGVVLVEALLPISERLVSVERVR